MSNINEGLYDRLIGNSLTQQAESQRELDNTITRLTSHSPDVADQYKTAPQPGYGPAKYQPRAIATSRDLISLHIPATSFDGSWSGFEQARDTAIAWLRSHRNSVENGGALCWGPAFGLDPEPLSYRDSSGTVWFNAGIEDEATFQLARIHVARA